MDNFSTANNNQKANDKWKMIAIVFIVFALLATAAGVFFFVKSNGLSGELTDVKKQNDENAKAIKKLNDKLSKSDGGTTGGTEVINSGGGNTTDSNTGYLVIKEWGIRFKAPEGISARYSITDDTAAIYVDSACSGPIIIIGRTTNGSLEHYDRTVADYGYKIGQYYYIQSAMQTNSGCSNESLANQARSALIAAVSNESRGITPNKLEAAK